MGTFKFLYEKDSYFVLYQPVTALSSATELPRCGPRTEEHPPLPVPAFRAARKKIIPPRKAAPDGAFFLPRIVTNSTFPQSWPTKLSTGPRCLCNVLFSGIFSYSGTKDFSLRFSPLFQPDAGSGLVELRNAVPKETLRHYLLTSSAEALPKTGSSLLSCFTNAESPKPQLQDRLSATGEALDLCSETALQSWFDPLDITLVQETNTLSVRFPHAFFGIRFASLFQKCFEKKARELWGKGLVVTYGGKTLPAPPPAVPETVPGEERKPDGVHPAVGNPTPFGEEWTFDTFIGNGKHKWALSLARDITRRAVFRATHPFSVCNRF